MHSYYSSDEDEGKQMEDPMNTRDPLTFYRTTTSFPEQKGEFEIVQPVPTPSRWARLVPFLKGTIFVMMVLGIVLALSLSYNTAITEQKHFMMNFEVQARVVKLEKALASYDKRLYLIEDLSVKKDTPSESKTP